jgi:ATP phosphoribosyltransferase regulatory subunit
MIKQKRGNVNLKRYDLLTPEGTRDLLFEECAARRAITEKLASLFENYGYSEVVTPGLEFFDVFNGKVRYFPHETMYKLVDGKNRLMVLRPDNTMPIARLAATRLKDEKLPLKLFCNQSIFMVNPKNSGRDDEFTQSGIEILGGNIVAADYEALALAAKALSYCDTDFRLEIGESGIFRELIADLDVSEDDEEKIREFIEAKNLPALREFMDGRSGKAAEAIKKLPALFGGREVFAQAKGYMYSETLSAKLSELEKLYDDLCGSGLDGKISVDLGLVHKKNYYTGILFRGYVEGYGLPVLSGGRYDTLLGDFGRDAAAVGFSVNVEAAAKVLLRKGKASLKAPDVLVYGQDGAETAAMKHCDKLIGEGLTVYNSLFDSIESAKEYAKEHNIHRLDIVSKDGSAAAEEV